MLVRRWILDARQLFDDISREPNITDACKWRCCTKPSASQECIIKVKFVGSKKELPISGMLCIGTFKELHVCGFHVPQE
ncbi:hypothetical protein RJT34_16356 [Clitoria ternatea]|uniref:Uncharacterized protein n=1 Tax=Clitoria ternatea TaxID=43366 RepID=A0AAN9J710_CLITE